MKILKIEKENLDGEKIIVHLEEYPHAQPVFDADISAKDLEIALKAWAVNQDEVDAINRAKSEEVKSEPILSAELKAMEGTTIKR